MLNQGQLKTIKKICVITLSNIGDVLLTFPVIDTLRAQFPDADISVVVGPKASDLFTNNSNITNVYIYDKKQSFVQFLFWTRIIRQENFDLVIDLRHSMIPLFLGARFRNSIFYKRDAALHMKDKHLDVLNKMMAVPGACPKTCLDFSQDLDAEVAGVISDKKPDQKLIVVAPGSAAENKHWPQSSFALLVDYLIEHKNAYVVFTGDHLDQAVVEGVESNMKQRALNLCNKTSLLQAAALISKADLVISNDSAPCHLASYLDTPVIALFGPTNALHYGPWGLKGRILRKNQNCEACQLPQKNQHHTCMQAIQVDDLKALIDEGGIFE